MAERYVKVTVSVGTEGGEERVLDTTVKALPCSAIDSVEIGGNVTDKIEKLSAAATIESETRKQEDKETRG